MDRFGREREEEGIRLQRRYRPLLYPSPILALTPPLLSSLNTPYSPGPPETAKSKKARREAAKRAAKALKLAGPTEPVIPLDEQTLDLPYVTKAQEVKRLVSVAGAIPGVSPTGAVAIGGEDGHQVGFEEAEAARDNVKRVRRDKNRKAIKEKNFLTSMS